MERLPPHDLEAEQAMVGSLLLDRDAVAQATISPRDFWHGANGLIYDAIVGLYARQEPTDLITLTAELTRRHHLEAAGGVAYVTRLLSVVPTAVHFPFYQDIVREKALLRDLIDVGANIVRIGYNESQASEVAVAEANALLQALSGKATKPAGITYEDAAMLFAQEIEERWAAGATYELARVLPTGFHNLDRMLGGGFGQGEAIVIAGRPGAGKALSLETRIPTPSGWTTMGALNVGDFVFGDDGKPTRIVAATDVMRDRPCYRVRFSDGSEIICDAKHQWRTSTRKHRKSTAGDAVLSEVTTTEDIAKTVRVNADQRLNHAVWNASALVLPDIDLPIPPYTLGAWLGDGARSSGRISKPDQEIFTRIEEDGFVCPPTTDPDVRTPRGLGVLLREIGLIDNKHIPSAYLRASERQRRELLAGLMDTDGYAGRAECEFCSTTRALARDIVELIRSLGVIANIRESRAMLYGRDCGPRWRITFMPNQQVFQLPRKAERCPIAKRPSTKLRFIESVEPIESVPVRCIEVDNASHLFLAGETMIPTHNSAMMLQLAHNVARRELILSPDPRWTLIFSSEMTLAGLVWRALAEVTRIPSGEIKAGFTLSPERKDFVRQKVKEMARLPIWIDDTSQPTTDQIKQRTERFAMDRPLGMVMFDYLQQAGNKTRGKDGNNEQRVAGVSLALKHLAKSSNIPVVELAQLNRTLEGRSDKHPIMADLRDSGQIEQDADKILFLYNQDYYESQGIPIEINAELRGMTEIEVAKNRDGAPGKCRVRFLRDITAFENAA